MTYTKLTIEVVSELCSITVGSTKLSLRDFHSAVDVEVDGVADDVGQAAVVERHGEWIEEREIAKATYIYPLKGAIRRKKNSLVHTSLK